MMGTDGANNMFILPDHLLGSINFTNLLETLGPNEFDWDFTVGQTPGTTSGGLEDCGLSNLIVSPAVRS